MVFRLLYNLVALCKGHYFINANSTTAPQIVERAVKTILCGLGNIQKIRDGESLGGKTSAADDFGTVADDDFLA